MSGTVLIFGATGGIGEAVASALTAAERRVHLCARDDRRAADLAQSLEASYSVGDVTDDAFLERAVAEAGDSLSGVVFAVGTLQLAPFKRVTTEAMLSDFSVNAVAGVRAVQAALPALKRHNRSSSVVFYSSIAADLGFSFHTSIAMSKGAVEAMTRTMAAELAPDVRVNAIAPSLTRTDLAAGLLRNSRAEERISEAHPMRRLGTVEDAAALTTFLLADESAWITGQVIGLDGGRSSIAGG